MNETIETIRHEITVQLIAYKKQNPSKAFLADDFIATMKEELCDCETDAEELIVLQRCKRLLVAWSIA